MKAWSSTVVVGLVLTGGAQARVVVHELTPANARQSGWRVEVAVDEEDRDLIRFTVWRGDKERTLKDGTTAQLVVRDGKRAVSTSGLGLQARDGEYVFTFKVAAGLLKESRFELLVLDLPHPSGDLYQLDLQTFYDARTRPGK